MSHVSAYVSNLEQTREAQTIYLRKRSRVLLGEGDGSTNSERRIVVASMAKNIEALGFAFSQALAEQLMSLWPTEAADFYKFLVQLLKKQVGAHRAFKPMYPNFPKQVMEASDAELYWNAMLHYWTAAASDYIPIPVYLPQYEKEKREPLKEDAKLKIIDLGTQADFLGIFTSLVGANTSLTAEDKETVAWFIKQYPAEIPGLIPESVPQKETLALLVSNLLPTTEPNYLLPKLKTATDVLRVATALCGGDVSLAAPVKFRKFNRKERRFLLGALDGCASATEDMLRHKEKWKRLAKSLHPGDYSKQFENAYKSFEIILNNKDFDTYNSKVEKSFLLKEVPLDLLAQRPGVLARRLDHAIRAAGDNAESVVKQFLAVADKVSTPVLLQVYNHFMTRVATQGQPRSFFPKGNVGKMQVVEDTRPKLNGLLTGVLANGVRETLTQRFRTLPPLGNVYLNPAMHEQLVPFAMRSASKTLRTITRGSRLALPDDSILRFFLWWKNGAGRTDIDLSAVLFNENWDFVTDISYYNLKDFGGCHSGDITNAPEGACEFIDINVEEVVKSGGRYVAMTLYSFTSQPYCDLPECFAGWMGRQSAQSGEIYEPKTVREKIDLSANSTVAIPLVFDLVARQAIWADLSMNGRANYYGNDGRSNRQSTNKLFQAIANLNKPNLYDLFSMHIEARGHRVETKAEAETIFDLYEGVTPFDYDKIASEFMA